MFINTYQNANDFLNKTQPILQQNEMVNSLMLGICIRLKTSSEQIHMQPYLATVDDEYGLSVAACMAPPHNIVLWGSDTCSDEALALVIQDMLAHTWPVPGVVGPAHVSQRFAAVWENITQRNVRDGLRQRLFELEKVTSSAPAPGMLRLATEHDRDTVAQWGTAFYKEAMHKHNDAGAQQLAETRIHAGDLYVWEGPDATIVTMAAKTRPLATTISIGFVYTPPAYRGRGYASNCVAALSQLLLDTGWQSCNLFTDLANPVSNSIYPKIGYRPVCDYNEYIFDQ